MKKTILILPIALAFVIGISLGTGVEAGGPFDCNGCIDKGDIGKKAVGKSEIKPNAVGGSEMKGTLKLIFGSCEVNIANTLAGNSRSADCPEPAAKMGDNVIAQFEQHFGANCLGVYQSAVIANGLVTFVLENHCGSSNDPPSNTISYILYKAK